MCLYEYIIYIQYSIKIIIKELKEVNKESTIFLHKYLGIEVE